MKTYYYLLTDDQDIDLDIYIVSANNRKQLHNAGFKTNSATTRYKTYEEVIERLRLPFLEGLNVKQWDCRS